MKKPTQRLPIIFLGLVSAFLLSSATSSSQASCSSKKEGGSDQKCTEFEPVKIVTEITSDGITLYHYYLTALDFERINGTLSKSWHLGEPDCISGAGNCATLSSTERIVYHSS